MSRTKNPTLRDLRIQAGKTVSEVAKILGVTPNTIYHYERGERQIGLEQVLMISEFYDCTAEDIIYGQLTCKMEE